MKLNNKKYRLFSTLRIIVALLVILSSVLDLIGSYTNETIQTIAQSDKMGYGGLNNFRTHMFECSLAALGYIGLVLLHMKKLHGKFMAGLIILIDAVILCFYITSLFEM